MITIGVSTIAEKRVILIERLSAMAERLPNEVSFLVVSQKETDNHLVTVSEKILLRKSSEIGLSKSRNLLLALAPNGWLWLQDDDLVLDFEELGKLVEVLSLKKNDLNFIKIRSLESRNTYYKNYEFFKNHQKLNCLKISSIEIILNTSFVLQHKIMFDETLGLGTSMPSCEENKFVLRLFEADADTSYLDISPCFHTTKIEDRNIDTTGRFAARGFLLKEFNIFLSFILMIRWAYKLDRTLRFSTKLLLMVKGFYKKNV